MDFEAGTQITAWFPENLKYSRESSACSVTFVSPTCCFHFMKFRNIVIIPVLIRSVNMPPMMGTMRKGLNE